MSLVAFKDLCIDVNDSRPASEFWAGTLGLELIGLDDSPDEFKLVGATPQHTVWPNVVPDRHDVKNRVHVDLTAASLEPFSDCVGSVSPASSAGRCSLTPRATSSVCFDR